ncbi:hypothetical protein N7492_008669 [Penicillium capsulatum]|uniref:Uncharacterized protein n=1 Tax=Penicillium capsulatum TaxID=69766 RepID=A0A9W9HR61_9EURO|nr:hypothetical protein N7492_008669 [Penicillium capsulatum]KAJ6106073.1 hypothetical protein N7512_009590 [Penicillium capsulatum]
MDDDEYSDLQPQATNNEVAVNQGDNMTEQLPAGPTDSHVISQLEPDEKGLAQQTSESADLTDLGWSNPADCIEEPLIVGLANEDLWMLIRRFDKQVYNVKAVSEAPLQNLDLTRADDDEFSPDKLRATMERFYTIVVIALTSSLKHVARIRSWKEPRRTAIFCAVYFLAWLLDILVPTIIASMVALIMYPPCRPLMFPPAPVALVDKDTGGIQKPKAGVLGSHDSITGAPERFKGEAVEQEASNLVASVASVAVGSAVGKHDPGVPDDAPLEGAVPDAMDIVSETADAHTAAQGMDASDTHDKTRQPMKQSVMAGANLLMQAINDVTDTFEKFGNALSATPPFPRLRPRLRLASILCPLGLASTLMSSYLFMKGVGLLVGVAFFGDPVIREGIGYLNRKYPHWQRALQLQNSLLKGIPTNAQLTLTLLRMGEANASPLPPPPISHEKAPSQPASLHHEELTLGATREEIEQATAAEPHTPDAEPNSQAEKPHRKTLRSRIVGVFRGTTATGIESKRGIDRMRAATGSRHAKTRVGVLRRKGMLSTPIGPVHFDARYKGKRGAVVIDSSKEPAILYFTTDVPESGELQLESRKPGSVLFTMPVSDIQEMRKVGGMGWKGKLVVGWAIGGKEVVDSLLLVGKELHQSYQLTAMGTRNQLFNRLIAMDGQVWEHC